VLKLFEEILANSEQLTFGVLFVGILVYSFKTNEKREERYQHLIKENQEMTRDLATRMREIREVKKDTENILKKVG